MALSESRKLDDATLWAAMRRLSTEVFSLLDREAGLDAGLRLLTEVLGADTAFVLSVSEDGSSQVQKATRRRSFGAADAEAEQALSQTVIRRALEEGRVVSWDPLASGTSSESALGLSIVAALAVPLARAPGAKRSVLYVDFRGGLRHVTSRHVEFFATAAPLLATLLDQGERLRLAQESLQEASRRPLVFSNVPSLDDLLSPPSLSALRKEVATVLDSMSSVLVLGESGTGKTLLAHALAEAGRRRPIVRATLGFSDDLNTITSELFGHEKGSFSGATSRRIGLVEHADGGTLVLDEILNLPKRAQQLLLDFTQFGTYRPLGWDKPQPKRAQVRILAATNGDLALAIEQGRFREDLYHRLAGVVLQLPPLRERRMDIPHLAESYLRRTEPSVGWTLSFSLRKQLVAPGLDWPGNVRQLERVIEHARDRARSSDPHARELLPEHVDLSRVERVANEIGTAKTDGQARDGSTPNAPQTIASAWLALGHQRAELEHQELSLLQRALDKHGFVVAQAARELGIARTTLSSRLEALGIRRPT